MTDATDMDAMATAADLIIDEFLGGHADANLAALFTSSNYLWQINNGTVTMKVLFAFLAKLINKVYDLENPT